ncbi:hypothetical protein [uncultured Arcticibacterium sp.]|uniref:hypothetical protein n=1 Tax=uncultured Arcticibacterium sp. TaxID=2173042 RepID=UPI0030FA06A7
MKKTSGLLAVAVIMVSFLISCGDKVDPISERVAKVWIPRLVLENSAVVYSAGGSGNVKPAYSSYRLNLSSPPQASLTDVDGQTYSGTYSVDGETKLTISGLTPEPTGTGGTLVFTINSLPDDASELEITLNGAYPKTGNTTNKYTLIPQ